jgi:REP element-mobilizing transposase RayT
MLLPGTLKMCTRRCSERRFFLRPDPETIQALLYCLGYCLEKYGVLIHEFIVLSNHLHIVYTDHADAPEFFRDLFSLSARAINTRWGHWESFWDPVPYHDLRLLEDVDVVAKSAYVLTNPVDAGLVRRIDEWGGPTSWNLDYGQEIEIERPAFFFRDRMPSKVKIRLSRPAICPELSDDELRSVIRDAARERETELVGRVLRAGGSFLGMPRVLRQARNASPISREPRRGIRPLVAGRSRWARAAALEDQRLFWQRHREACDLWRGGNRGVVFPYGTYLMERRFRVCVEDIPPTAPAASMLAQ